MCKGFYQKLILISLLSFSTSLFAANLKLISFEQEGEVSKIVLDLDEDNVEASKFHFDKDKQLILDLKDTAATKRVLRAFDTSEFSGSIVFVSAYPKVNQQKDLRVAIQLRDNVRSILRRYQNRLVLEIENRYGVFDQVEVERNKSLAEKIAAGEEAGRVHIPKSESVEDILQNLTLSGRKKYIGKKISFNVKDISVVDLLKMIAEVSGFNLIISDDVKKKKNMTLSLTNIPWDQALDTILDLNDLVASKNGIILSITTIENASRRREKEMAVRKLAENQEPLVTKVFPISYSTLKEMEKILKDYLTPNRGTIALDERTNSFIVKDTVAVIEKLKKIVETLDTQTPQVLIESKIVEVTEAYAKEIGLKNGINFGYDPVTSPITGGTRIANEGPGFTVSTAPSSGQDARTLFGLTIGRFSRLLDLNFQLQLMESESKGKIVASPKVITQNKKAAKISSVDTTSYSVVEGVGADQTTSFKEISATLSLSVTPQVTNEGSIVLEVDLSKDQFGARPAGNPNAPPDKATRQIATNVLVDNGSTIVIGGIYTYSKLEAHTGIPFLKDIPLIGWLFRSAYAPEMKKSEMIIFLTPRVINQEEAGIAQST